MATSQKLTDQFLTCTVCMEVFNNPVTLLCYHTFCQKCVVSFTKTQPEAIDAKSIPCPFCWKWTKVTDPDRPVEEWAGQLKPSFLIQGLIDSFGPGTKDTSFCEYCKGEGETTSAVAWCSVCDESLCELCVRTHNRVPSFRHHDVTELSGEVKVKAKRMIMCKEHKAECIEFMCKDCKIAVCQKCCIIYHRKCDSVVTIKSELPSMKSALNKTRVMLLGKQDHSKIQTQEKESRVEDVRKIYSKTESKIKSSGQNVRDIISQKEKILLDKLKEGCYRQIGQLKAGIKAEEMTLQMNQQQSELIDQALKSDCEMDIYDMYRACDSGAVDDNGTPDEPIITNVCFTQKTDTLAKAVNELQLGEINVMYEGKLDRQAPPVLQGTVDLSMYTDPSQTYPSDVTVLDVSGRDTVVVTDRNNKCIKSFYRRKNKDCQSKLSLESVPWSLTKLKQNQVAVTIPALKRILIAEVNPDLKLMYNMTTSKEYLGITTLKPSRLAASSDSPPSVDILDLTGTVVKTIAGDQHTSNQAVLKQPNFLKTTKKGNILVSDWGTTSVLCLTPRGDVVFNYCPEGITALQLPRGITVTNTGDILVADWDLNKVLHLTESGHLVRNILTSENGISYPIGLHIDIQNRLYVCLYNEGIVKVFQLGTH